MKKKSVNLGYYIAKLLTALNNIKAVIKQGLWVTHGCSWCHLTAPEGGLTFKASTGTREHLCAVEKKPWWRTRQHHPTHGCRLKANLPIMITHTHTEGGFGVLNLSETCGWQCRTRRTWCKYWLQLCVYFSSYKTVWPVLWKVSHTTFRYAHKVV